MDEKLRCGLNKKYAVIKLDDVEKYLNLSELTALDYIFEKIQKGRKKDNKKANNEYVVVNTDESYANEIIDIVKRHI